MNVDLNIRQMVDKLEAVDTSWMGEDLKMKYDIATNVLDDANSYTLEEITEAHDHAVSFIVNDPPKYK